jgi:hypothetical protein
MYALDRSHVEEGQEPLEAPTQAEEAANAELTEGKHRCIPPIILDFCFNHYFMLSIFLHYVYRELIDALVALHCPSELSLITPLSL